MLAFPEAAQAPRVKPPPSYEIARSLQNNDQKDILRFDKCRYEPIIVIRSSIF